MTHIDYKKKFHAVPGTGMPLGVSVIDKARVQFSVMVSNVTWCELHLKKKKGREIIKIVLDKKFRIGSVFSVILTLDSIYDYCYSYQTEYGCLCDPYAQSLLDRGEWAVKPLAKEWAQIPELDFTESSGYHSILQMNEMIMYRLHVRGFTKHTSSKVKGKGTFLGVMEKIPYLKELGINAVELMPCYDFNERSFMGQPDFEFMKYQRTNAVYPRDRFRPKEVILAEEEQAKKEKEKNLIRINYWGYTDRAYYFAPKASFAYDKQHANREFLQMVEALHGAGIEVIMEMFLPKDMYAGMIADCLRHWHVNYKVDGFRLTNDAADVVRSINDPYLSDAKIFRISFSEEDASKNAKTFGKVRLSEYNDNFMVTARKLLKGDEGMVPSFVECFLKNRRHMETVNYIANTNGFTLMDLVSYDQKHNTDNGENGNDGTEYNYSWNCGIEGPCKKKAINRLRMKQIKNAFLFVLLSQGIPLFMAGDEWGNTQHGNNNAYCQDNEISWLKWKPTVFGNEIREFVKKAIELRKNSPHFHAMNPFKYSDYLLCGYPDVSIHGTRIWYPDYSYYSRAFAVMIAGRYFEKADGGPGKIAESSGKAADSKKAAEGLEKVSSGLKKVSDGSEQTGESVKRIGNYYLIFNLFWQNQTFDLPSLKEENSWEIVIASFDEKEFQDVNIDKKVNMPARAIMVLKEKVE